MSTVKPSDISSSASSSIVLNANASVTSTPGVRGAKALPSSFNTSHSGRDPHAHHTEAANAVLSLILVIMVGFVAFMSVFFWRKYKHITLSVPTYQYSRLSQHEGEADLSEVVDQLGLTLGNSSSDDELEPATLPISASQYQGPHTGSFTAPAAPTVATNGNVAALSSALLDDSDEKHVFTGSCQHLQLSTQKMLARPSEDIFLGITPVKLQGDNAANVSPNGHILKITPTAEPKRVLIWSKCRENINKFAATYNIKFVFFIHPCLFLK